MKGMMVEGEGGEKTTTSNLEILSGRDKWDNVDFFLSAEAVYKTVECICVGKHANLEKRALNKAYDDMKHRHDLLTDEEKLKNPLPNRKINV